MKCDKSCNTAEMSGILKIYCHLISNKSTISYCYENSMITNYIKVLAIVQLIFS